MRTLVKILSIVVLALTVALTLTGQSIAQEKEKIKIVTTINQITDAVRIIGGDQVLVSGLMGPGVDPHLYKASKNDVDKLAEADLIIYNGFNLEANMDPMFKSLKRSKATVALAESVPVELRLENDNYKGKVDPHVWTDDDLWQKEIERIAEALSEFDPEHEKEYGERASTYLAEFEQLHEYVNNRVKELPETKRFLVSAHDAFRYFGRKYGFEVKGLQEGGIHAKAGRKEAAQLADLLIRRKVRVIFTESSASDQFIKAVQEAAAQRNWDIEIVSGLFSDAMDIDGTSQGSYIGMMAHNIDIIVNSLKK